MNDLSFEEAMKRPILTVKQAKEWDGQLEKQTAKSTIIKE